MRLVSFNVNGIRAMRAKLRNGDRGATEETHCLERLLDELEPDFLCLQEIKTNSLEDCQLRGPVGSTYTVHASFAAKKGYSGVALYAKESPEWVDTDFSRHGENTGWEFQREGRILVAKFARVCIVNVYVPNAQADLARIDVRLEWERLFRDYVRALREQVGVPVVICGDLNCAAEKIDIHDPVRNKEAAGFSPQERGALRALLSDGWIDTYRHLHHFRVEYSYFSNIGKCRAKNKGWRIDYCLSMSPADIEASAIHGEYYGSDHCPVRVDINIRGIPTKPLKATLALMAELGL